MAKQLMLLALVMMSIVPLSCQHQPYVAPIEARTGDLSLCFDRDILPIFISECAKSGCHDANRHDAGYVLDNYENITKKGINPGNAAGSKIYQSIMGYTEERMPQGAPVLSAEKTVLIKKWIDAGAIKDSNCHSDCDSNEFKYSTAIQPMINKYCVGCHGGTSPQGNLNLIGYDNMRTAVLTKNLVKCIKYTPGYNAMPLGGLHLSDCEIKQVDKWVADSMPNN